MQLYAISSTGVPRTKLSVCQLMLPNWAKHMYIAGMLMLCVVFMYKTLVNISTLTP